jgi:hypothetical protein
LAAGCWPFGLLAAGYWLLASGFWLSIEAKPEVRNEKCKANSQQPGSLSYKSVKQLAAFRGPRQPALPRLRDSFEISSSICARPSISTKSISFSSTLSHRIA